MSASNQEILERATGGYASCEEHKNDGAVSLEDTAPFL